MVGSAIGSPPRARVQISAGQTSVVVVDDEPGVRELLLRVLRREGYRVLAAENGAEALELIAREELPVALLVSDIDMPRMSGIDLAAELRGLHPRMSILFVSASIQLLETLPPAMRSRVFTLEKPFTPGELVSRVRLALEAGSV